MLQRIELSEIEYLILKTVYKQRSCTKIDILNQIYSSDRTNPTKEPANVEPVIRQLNKFGLLHSKGSEYLEITDSGISAMRYHETLINQYQKQLNELHCQVKVEQEKLAEAKRQAAEAKKDSKIATILAIAALAWQIAEWILTNM